MEKEWVVRRSPHNLSPHPLFVAIRGRDTKDNEDTMRIMMQSPPSLPPPIHCCDESPWCRPPTTSINVA